MLGTTLIDVNIFKRDRLESVMGIGYSIGILDGSEELEVSVIGSPMVSEGGSKIGY